MLATLENEGGIQMEANCIHGKFDVNQGCPECVMERRRQDGIIPEDGDTIRIDATMSSKAWENALTSPTNSLTIETDEDFLAHYAQACRLEEYAVSRVIVTPEDSAGATNDLTIIKELINAMEAKRKGYVTPLNEKVNKINAFAKKMVAPVKEADKITRDKQTAYLMEQNRKRQEQEKINQLRIEAAQKEAEMNNGEISESVNLVEVQPEVKSTRSDLGMTSLRDNWSAEVYDSTILPDIYKMPNMILLNDMAKKCRDIIIPGVKWVNKPSIMTTTKKS